MHSKYKKNLSLDHINVTTQTRAHYWNIVFGHKWFVAA